MLASHVNIRAANEIDTKSGCGAGLSIMMDYQIPVDDFIVHFF